MIFQIGTGRVVTGDGKPVAYFERQPGTPIRNTIVHLLPGAYTLGGVAEIVRHIESLVADEYRLEVGEKPPDVSHKPWEAAQQPVMNLSGLTTLDAFLMASGAFNYDTTRNRQEIWVTIERVVPETLTSEQADRLMLVLENLLGRMWTTTVTGPNMKGLPVVVQRCVDACTGDHLRFKHLFQKTKDAGLGDFKKAVKNSADQAVLQVGESRP